MIKRIFVLQICFFVCFLVACTAQIKVNTSLISKNNFSLKITNNNLNSNILLLNERNSFDGGSVIEIHFLDAKNKILSERRWNIGSETKFILKPSENKYVEYIFNQLNVNLNNVTKIKVFLRIKYFIFKSEEFKYYIEEKEYKLRD